MKSRSKGGVAMGFRYRKSINLGGGFRINISKSGIGYSWGVKGYRVTKTAKGTTRRTASIPGTGISFVDETGKKKQRGTFPANPRQVNPSVDANTYDTEDIINGVATDMVSEGLEDILAAVRKTLLVNNVSTIGILASLVISCANPVFIVFLIGFIALKAYAKTAGLVDLEYVIDSDQQEEVDRRMDPMLKVTDSEKVWRIMQSSKVIDKKYSAGASSTVKRVACVAGKKAPFPFKANTPAASFKAGKETLVFLPDKLFIIQKSKVGALNYSDIQTFAHTTRFVESEKVPKDTSVVGSTWKYVNKSGGPDKRFKDNRELPICLYGEIELKSSSGLNTVLMFSNADLK